MMLRALIAHSSGYVANSVTTLRITLADAFLPQAIMDGITGGHMMFEGRVPNAKGLFVSGPAYAMVDLRFDTTRSMVEFQVMFNGLPLVPEMMKLVNHYMTRFMIDGDRRIQAAKVVTQHNFANPNIAHNICGGFFPRIIQKDVVMEFKSVTSDPYQYRYLTEEDVESYIEKCLSANRDFLFQFPVRCEVPFLGKYFSVHKILHHITNMFFPFTVHKNTQFPLHQIACPCDVYICPGYAEDHMCDVMVRLSFLNSLFPTICGRGRELGSRRERGHGPGRGRGRAN